MTPAKQSEPADFFQDAEVTEKKVELIGEIIEPKTEDKSKFYLNFLF